jgi:hypothetical protein
MSVNICNDSWIDIGFRIGDFELDVSVAKCQGGGYCR